MKKKLSKRDICKSNGFHTWCKVGEGIKVDSVSEDLDEMEVVFSCWICGAEASGTVYWDEEEDDEE